MVYALTWLPDVLEAAGLKVAEVPGWRTRGRAEMGEVRGVMCHHTGTNKRDANMPTLQILIDGRAASPGAPALQGPLAQLGLGRDGTFYVIAAGRANHAGVGSWEGIVTGNASFIGIEAENSGLADDEPWPAVQMDAYQRGVAAILGKIGAAETMCCGHKEYALPAGRKTDPTFDMPTFRRAVSALMKGKSPPPPIPALDSAQRPTLRRGASGEAVATLQARLGLPADGVFGPATEAAVRAFQRGCRPPLTPDGIVGPASWAALPQAPATPPAEPTAASPTPAEAAARPAVRTAALVAAAPAAGPAGLPPADDPEHPPTVSGGTALGPDGRRFASRHALGFATMGVTSLATFLGQPEAAGPSPSASVRRVVAAVSANEGGLEAINSWDNCHLSLGVFQWSAGADADPGELPGLLAMVKTANPAAFADLFTAFGLDVMAAQGGDLITLAGRELRDGASKDALRSVAWAYRFWRAGHHPSVRSAQLDLAAARIRRFIDAAVGGRTVAAWLTSELGVALVLDEHVNRPGHVPGTLSDALTGLGQLAQRDPADWTTDDEARLIEAYLAARAKTSMTDSDGRATRIKACVTNDTLSEARGSFVP
jgi:N-acetyl-anhydromuramyl-L-alanine amidase AmpD